MRPRNEELQHCQTEQFRLGKQNVYFFPSCNWRCTMLEKHRKHSAWIFFFALSLFNSLGGSKAYAQCGWLDPTCHPSKWNRPPITFPKPSSGGSESCLAVMSYPKEYSWSIRNDKTYQQTFWLDGKEYRLDAGRIMSFTSKVGSSCTSSCSCSATYTEPTIEFDRYANDGAFTSQKFTVNVVQYSMFNFWKDGNVIKFSSGSPR